MDRNSYETSSTNGMAFIQGAVVGAIAALLFAPKTGRELRRQLGDYTRTTGERAREIADEGLHAVNKTLEKGREIAHEASEAGQRAFRSERERIDPKGS